MPYYQSTYHSKLYRDFKAINPSAYRDIVRFFEEKEDNIRKLDEERRLSIREFSFEVREMKKKAMKGDSDIRRGQQMQSSAAKSLKSSQKALRDARERYDLAMSPLLN